jgi:hypothetical protein
VGEGGAPTLELSQIIYGVRDLAAATARIAARGLMVLDGGRHPGLGTANRIVPLGRAYFEILGVVDEAEARANPYGAALLRQIVAGDRLVRWSLRTDALDRVAAERGLVPEIRSRRRPDGSLLTWRAAGLSLSLDAGWLPFFMAWDDPAEYPGMLPVAHPAQPSGVAWLSLTPGDPQRLRRWLGDARPPLRVVAGEPGLHQVALHTPDGLLILP